MKINYWIEGTAVHPVVHGGFEVDDSEIAGMDEEQAEAWIGAIVQAEVENQVQWGWERA